MDIYDFSAIVTSTRLTSSEEAELRSASESIDHPPSPFSLPLAEGKGTPKQGDTNSNLSSGTHPHPHPQHHLQLPKLGLSLATRTVSGWADQSPKSSRCSSRCSSKCSSLQEETDGDHDRLQILASASIDQLEVEELSPAAAVTSLPVVMTEPSIVVTTVPLPSSSSFLAPVLDVQVPREETRITLESPTILPRSITSVHAASPIISVTSHCNQSTIILMPAPISKVQQAPIESSSTVPAPAAVTPWLDREHFKTVFRELAKYTEQVEKLNDQILEAMTLYRFTASASVSPSISASEPPPLSLSATSSSSSSTSSSSSSSAAAAVVVVAAASSSSSSPSSSSPEETRRRSKGKERAVNLEEDRHCIATAFTELALDSWPRVYAKAPSAFAHETTPAAAASATIRARKDRAWTATKLKEAIVAFWEVHSHFHERAQLVVDIYEDPSELEQRDRMRLLKSRHLNNLLQHDPLPPWQAKQAVEQFKAHSHAMASQLDRLQHVYLGLLLLLGDPQQTGSSSDRRRYHRWDLGSLHLCGGGGASSSSSSSSSSFPPTTSSDVAKDLGIGCLKVSKNQLLALKVAVLLLFGAGMIGMALVLNSK